MQNTFYHNKIIGLRCPFIQCNLRLTPQEEIRKQIADLCFDPCVLLCLEKESRERREGGRQGKRTALRRNFCLVDVLPLNTISPRTGQGGHGRFRTGTRAAARTGQ